MIGRKGIRDALLAAVLFGLSAPVAKALLLNLQPQLLAGLLYLGAGAGLTAVSLIRSRVPLRSAGIHARDVPFLAGAIGFGGIAAPVLLMLGLQRTSSSTSSLLLNLEAVFTASIAWVLFRENVNSRVVVGLMSIVAGGVVLSWSGTVGSSGLWGPIAIAAACLCWGFDNNLTQKISNADAVGIAAIKGLVAGSVNGLIAAALGQWHSSNWIPLGLALGFFSYGLSLVLYIRALRELGTARAGNYFSIAPFVGALLGVLLWRESITPGLLASGLLMALGVGLHLTETHEHRHVHEPMSHEHEHVHDEHHQHEHSPDDPPGEPHSHPHRHERLEHSHPHYPDIHHRHPH